MSTPVPVNTHRYDPYKNFKFRIKWRNEYVAAANKISTLDHTPAMLPHLKDTTGSTRNLPGSAWKYEPITIERGVIQDAGFEAWANTVMAVFPHAQTSMRDTVKDLIIEMLDEKGIVEKTYKIHDCYVSAYVAAPVSNTDPKVVAISQLVIQHNGWEPL